MRQPHHAPNLPLQTPPCARNSPAPSTTRCLTFHAAEMPPSPPTESSILTAYLLLPADLRAIVTPRQFAAFFPKPHSSSPQIPALYRDLETQRAATIAEVRDNIEAEVRKGRKMRAEVARIRREAEEGGGDDEVEIERAVRIPSRAAASFRFLTWRRLTRLGGNSSLEPPPSSQTRIIPSHPSSPKWTAR